MQQKAVVVVYCMVTTMTTLMMNSVVYSVVVNCYCCYFDWVVMTMGWMLTKRQEIISFHLMMYSFVVEALMWMVRYVDFVVHLVVDGVGEYGDEDDPWQLNCSY